MLPPAFVAQTGVSPLAVAGTFGLLALFLSLTAFLAARNVLGDVSAVKALGVGPFPAAVAVAAGALGLPSGPAIAVAVFLDAVAIHYFYGDSASLTTYITFIHIVVTILLGTVVFGLLILLGTIPA